MGNRLNLRHLTSFVAVAEELNFRRAAERLAMTQPPLSRQIRALEDTLGAPLFVRDRQGVRLTDAGMAFLPDARKLLDDSRQAVRRFSPPTSAPRTDITLGVTTSVDVGLFSWVGAACGRRNAPIGLQVRRQISAHCVRDLDNGSMDVALIGLPARAEGLRVEALFDDPLMACLPSSHPLARKRSVSLPGLQGDRLFWFARRLNPTFHDYCERIFKTLNYAPERLPEPPDHAALLGLVAIGQGVALVPRSLTKVRRKGVVFRPLAEADRLMIRIGLAVRAGPLAPPVQALVELIKAGPPADDVGTPRR